MKRIVTKDTLVMSFRAWRPVYIYLIVFSGIWILVEGMTSLLNENFLKTSIQNYYILLQLLFIVITFLNLIYFEKVKDIIVKAYFSYSFLFNVVSNPLVFTLFSLIISLTFQFGITYGTKTSAESITAFFICGFALLTLYGLIFFQWIGEVKEVSNKPLKGFRLLDDSPLRSIEDDKLNRKVHADRIFNIIKQTCVNESFVLGISSPWGTGKTSLLEWITVLFNNDPDVLVVKYSPWNYESSKVHELFFKELGKEISQRIYSPDVISSLKLYSNLLGNFDLKYSYILNFASKFLPFEQDRSIDSIRERLETKLLKLPFRIVVVLDDFDRLDKESILSLFSLIRGGASFPNLTYVLSYDRQNLISKIDDNKRVIGHYDQKSISADVSNVENGISILEKLVQHEYWLPDLQTENVLNLVEFYVKYAVQRKYKGKELNDLIREIREYVELDFRNGGNHFFTPRRLKQFLNSFLPVYKRLHNEIQFEDLMDMTLILRNYPQYHQEIIEQPWRYLGSWATGYSWTLSQSEFITKQEKNTDNIEHLNSLEPDPERRERVMKILKRLFWYVAEYSTTNSVSTHRSMHDYRAEQRICHMEVYVKYALQYVPQNWESDKKVGDFIKKFNNGESSFTVFLSKVPNRSKVLILFNKWIEKIAPSKFEMAYSQLIATASKLNNEHSHERLHDDVISVVMLVLRIVNKMSEDKIKEFFDVYITTIKDYSIIVLIVDLINSDSGSELSTILKVTNRDQIAEKVFSLLCELLITQKQNVYELNLWPYLTFQWGTKWKSLQDTHPDVSKYIIKSVKTPQDLLDLLDKRFLVKAFLRPGEEPTYQFEQVGIKSLVAGTVAKARLFLRETQMSQSEREVIEDFINAYNHFLESKKVQ